MKFNQIFDTDLGRSIFAVAAALPITAVLMVGVINLLDAATSSMMF